MSQGHGGSIMRLRIVAHLRAHAQLSFAACVGLLAFSIAAFAQQTIGGRWHGWGLQRPPEGLPEYPVCIALDGENGTIDYPSFPCGGSLTRLSGDQTRAVFRERITYGIGNCVDGGEVTLHLVKDKLSLTWLGTYEGISVSLVALLNRVGERPAGVDTAKCDRRQISDARPP